MKKLINLLKDLADDNKYMVIIYDGEYNHYVIEILSPYGDIISAGLATELEDAIDDAKKNMEGELD